MRDSQIVKVLDLAMTAVTMMLTFAWPQNSSAADSGMTAFIASIHADRSIRDALAAGPIARDASLERRVGSPWFQTPIKWQSGVNIAGSRVWTKVIEFSSNGIKIQLPLN